MKETESNIIFRQYMGYCREVIDYDGDDDNINDKDKDSGEGDDQILIRGHGPPNKIGWHDAKLEHILVADFDIQFNLRNLF